MEALIADEARAGNTDAWPLSKLPPGAAGTAFTTADNLKLDQIETQATRDQTAEEIRDDLVGLSGSNRLPATAIRDLPAPGGQGLSQSQVDERVEALVEDWAEVKHPTVEIPAGKLPAASENLDTAHVQVLVDRGLAPVVQDVANNRADLDNLENEVDTVLLDRPAPVFTRLNLRVEGHAFAVGVRTVQAGRFYAVMVRGYGREDTVGQLDGTTLLRFGNVSAGDQLVAGVNGVGYDITDVNGADTAEDVVIGHDGANVYATATSAVDPAGNQWQVDVVPLTRKGGQFFTGAGLLGDPSDADDPLRVDLSGPTPPASELLSSVEAALAHLYPLVRTSPDLDLALLESCLATARAYFRQHFTPDGLATEEAQYAASRLTAGLYRLRDSGVGDIADPLELAIQRDPVIAATMAAHRSWAF